MSLEDTALAGLQPASTGTMNNYVRKLDQVDTASTARIDRRQSVLAQIEAALLADKISVLEISEEGTGTDPYNSVRPRVDTWQKRAR